MSLDTVNLAMEIWDTDEIGDGVFCTTLTHPLFDGKLTFLHGSEESGEAFIKNLKDQFNAKYKSPTANSNQGQSMYKENSTESGHDWKKDIVDIVGLAAQLERNLSSKDSSNGNCKNTGVKRSSF